MAERDGVALPRRKLRELDQQSSVADPILRLTRRIFFRYGRVCDGAAQPRPAAMSAKVVERRVTCDPEKPCRGCGVARLEPPVRLVGVHKDLRGDVLGVGSGADLGPDIGVDAPEVFPVEVLERGLVGRHGRFMVWKRTVGCPAPKVRSNFAAKAGGAQERGAVGGAKAS